MHFQMFAEGGSPPTILPSLITTLDTYVTHLCYLVGSFGIGVCQNVLHNMFTSDP